MTIVGKTKSHRWSISRDVSSTLFVSTSSSTSTRLSSTSMSTSTLISNTSTSTSTFSEWPTQYIQVSNASLIASHAQMVFIQKLLIILFHAQMPTMPWSVNTVKPIWNHQSTWMSHAFHVIAFQEDESRNTCTRELRPQWPHNKPSFAKHTFHWRTGCQRT